MKRNEGVHNRSALYASKDTRIKFAGVPRRKPDDEVPAPVPDGVPANDDEPKPTVRPYIVPPPPQFVPDPDERRFPR